jgi:diacylglycerol O-acyltransferase-1
MATAATLRRRGGQPLATDATEPDGRNDVAVGGGGDDGDDNAFPAADDSSSTLHDTGHDYLGSHEGSGADEVHRLKKAVALLSLQLRVAKLRHSVSTEANKKRDDQSASRPIHVAAHPSLLSKDSPSPPDFRGFLNLVLIVAVMSNLRLLLANLLEYGVLIGSARQQLPETQASLAGFAAFAAAMAAHVGVALAAEKLRAFGGTAGVAIGTALHVVNCAAPLATSLLVAHAFDIGAFVSVNVALQAAVVHLKLVSYAHCNHDLRMRALRVSSRRNGDGNGDGNSNSNTQVPHSSSYPANVTAGNLALFMTFPTLVYQSVYPRTDRIRWAFVARYALQLFVCVSLFAAVVQQFLVPAFLDSAAPLRQADVPRILERGLMRTAVPLLAAWLLAFWGTFELGLNLLAELTRFADREFYLDWWNSRTLDECVFVA